jgi:hypothetical protein
MIIGIVPADGWYALSEDGDVIRLSCFALVAEGDGSRIVALDGTLDPAFAPETSGADWYVYLGEPSAPDFEERRDSELRMVRDLYEMAVASE